MPLLVTVPSSVAVEPFWTVAVLPVLMVTPLSVLFPTYMMPPLVVVSVPPSRCRRTGSRRSRCPSRGWCRCW